MIQSDRPRIIVGLGATGASCVRHFARRGSSFEVWDSERQPSGLEAVRALVDDSQLHLGASQVEVSQRHGVKHVVFSSVAKRRNRTGKSR